LFDVSIARIKEPGLTGCYAVWMGNFFMIWQNRGIDLRILSHSWCQRIRCALLQNVEKPSP